MSLPRNCKAEVTRSETVSVSYLVQDGQQYTVRNIKGNVARQIQHEIDHLNGILIIDYPKRSHFNSRLMVAAAIYLLVLTVAVGLYIRNRVRDRKRTS